MSQKKIRRRASWMKRDENMSLWARDPVPRNPPLRSDLEVDVAIVGAGYTGLSSAYHIKRLLPEKRVAVFEAKRAGHGASGRNGGMCLNQPSIDYMSVVHPESHRQTYDATAQSIRELADLMRAQGFGSDISFRGSLMVNLGEKGARKSRDYAAKTAALGIPIEYWDRDRISKEIGASCYAGGLFDPNAAEVDPMKMVRALKESSERLGVTIYEDSPVLEVKDGRPVRLLVREESGEIHKVSADSLVLGTDAYTRKLGLFRTKIIVSHTEMAATKPFDKETFDRIGWRNRIPFHDDRAYLYHLGTTEDGRITIGAGNAEYFFKDNPIYKKKLRKRYKALKKELQRIYPSLGEVEFEHIWSGTLSFSLDMSQSVGVIGKEKNIYYGLGYAGHGVTLAFLFGKVIADMYAGKGSQWEAMPFYQNEFIKLTVPEPLRYLSVKGYMNYLRLRDLIGKK